VNVEDSQSEPWSLDVGSNPGFTYKTRWKDGLLDGRKNNEKIKAVKWGKLHTKKIKK